MTSQNKDNSCAIKEALETLDELEKLIYSEGVRTGFVFGLYKLNKIRTALEDSVSRCSLIEEFKRLKSGQSVRDELYLAGVISVIETHDLPTPPETKESE